MKRSVDAVVASFAAELREAMRDELIGALSSWEGKALPKLPPAHVAKALRKPYVSKRGGGKPRRFVRTREVVDAESDRFVDFVTRNPGSLSKQVQKALGMRPSQFANATVRLRNENRIRCQGERKDMRWFPIA